MPNKDKTAMQMVLDRSGSMDKIRKEAEGGIQHFIEEQRKVPGDCTLRVSHFDTQYEVVYESTPIAEAVPPAIYPRGLTALLDAWGRAMTEFGEELAALPEDQRPGTVIFVVVTDGEENASREWTRERVFAKVSEQTDVYGWTFLFLAANQDAVAEGARLGVPVANSITYDTGQVDGTYQVLSDSVTRTRSGHSKGFTDADRVKTIRG